MIDIAVPDQTVRITAQSATGRAAGVNIVTTGGGAQGQPAGQDFAVGATGGPFTAGFVVTGPRLAHAASINTLWGQSETGVAGNQTLVVSQMRLGEVVATAELPWTPASDFPQAAVTALNFAAGDYAAIALPEVPDTQLADFLVTFGSTP